MTPTPTAAHPALLLAPITLLRNAHHQATTLHHLPAVPLQLKSPTGDDMALDHMAQASHVSFPLGEQGQQGQQTLALHEPSGYKEYSTLSVVYFYMGRSLEHPAYLQQATAAGLKPVSFIDRRDMLAYLEGGPASTSVHVKAPGATGAAGLAAGHGSSRQPGAPGTGSTAGAGSGLLGPDGQTNLQATLHFSPTHTVAEARAEAQALAAALQERSPRSRKNILTSRTSRPLTAVERAGQAFFRREGGKPGSGSTAAAGITKVRHHSASVANSTATKPSATHPSKSAPSSSSVHAKLPIILVPNVPATTVNLYNIKEFLIDKKYVSPEELRQAQGGVRPERVVLERPASDAPHGVRKFEVLDSVKDFKKEDWDRVVAVFTTGQEWVFKTWKYSNPVDLFTHTCGFCVRFIDDTARGAVDTWNVTIMGIHRNRQHMNVTVVYSFWSKLDQWIEHHKPGLFR